MKKISFVVLLALMVNPGIDAQKSYLTTTDSLNSSMPLDGIYSAFDLIDGLLFSIEGDTITAIELETATTLQKFGMPGLGYSGFPGFITLSPDGLKLWVGYTTSDNSDDRIFLIDTKTGDWQHMANLPGNFDLAFWNGQPMVSGLNSQDWSSPNAIWLLDITGENQHRLLIATGGYSAGLDIDDDGNIYYGTSFFSNNALIKWEAEKVEAALASLDDTLKIEDAVILTSLPSGVYDIDLDKRENLVFNNNNFIENFIGKWDGANSYDTLATSPLFLTRLSTRGVVTSRNPESQVFALAYGSKIAEIHYDIPPEVSDPFIDFTVPIGEPEPSTINLDDIFQDQDDHDSIFSYTLLENSNPLLIEGEIDNNLLLITVIGQQPGTVNLVAEGRTGIYSVTDTLMVTVTWPTGNTGYNPETAVLIYPNPTVDLIRIEYGSGTWARLRLIEITGQVVMREEHIDSGDAIDISHLEPGRYILQLHIMDYEYNTVIIKR